MEAIQISLRAWENHRILICSTLTVCTFVLFSLMACRWLVVKSLSGLYHVDTK